MNEYLRDNAIHTFKQGDINSARQMFLECIRQDPRDVQAWLWLVETISDNNDRIATLRLCQKYNPDYEQVRQAISILGGSLKPKQASDTSPETLQPEIKTMPQQKPGKDIPLKWENLAGTGSDLESELHEVSQKPKVIPEKQPELSDKPISSLRSKPEQTGITKRSHLSVSNESGTYSFRDGLHPEKEQPVKDSLEEKREAILERISQLSSNNSTPSGEIETEMPSAGKEKSAKRRVPFTVSMTLITILLVVLFAFTFFDWWVLSGKDPDQILSLFNGGKISSGEAVLPSTEIPVAGMATYPSTYTPQPLPTATFTPAPTINPFFAGVYQNDVPPEKLLDLPSVASVATGKGMVAYQGSDGQLVILDAASEKLANFTLPSSQPSQALSFSEDGQYLANAELNGTITVWTTLTKPWEEVITLSLNTTGQSVQIKQLTFTSNNSGLLVGFCNSFENECIEIPRLIMYDIPRGIERFNLSGFDHGAFRDDYALVVWAQNQTATDIRLLSVENGTDTTTLASALPPDGEGWVIADHSHTYVDVTCIGAVSTKGLVRIWDGSTGEVKAEWTTSVTSPDQILFSPDLTQVVIANDQSMAEVWEISTQTKLVDFNLKADYGQFFWTSDWKLLCIRTVKPSMSIWDVMTLQSLEEITGPDSIIKEILLLPKNHKMLVVTETGNISLWRSDFIR